MFGGNNPGAEPFDVQDRHWATTAHPEDKNDWCICRRSRAPAVADRHLGLGDHLELSGGETEFQIGTSVEDRNGVDDMVAVSDKSRQVALNEFPDGNLLLDLNAISTVAEAVECAKRRQALGGWKKGQCRKIPAADTTNW